MKAWKEITRILLLVAGCVVLYFLLQQSNLLSSEGYAPAMTPVRDIGIRAPSAREQEAVRSALRSSLPPAANADRVQPMNFPSNSISHTAPAAFEASAPPPMVNTSSFTDVDVKPAPATAQASFCSDPTSCWPSQTLTSEDLLPRGDQSSKFAELYPEGQGSLKDRSFLESGYLVGMTQVTKNSNYGLRSEPPVPRFSAGPWMQSTIESTDHMRRALDTKDW